MYSYFEFECHTIFLPFQWSTFLPFVHKSFKITTFKGIVHVIKEVSFKPLGLHSMTSWSSFLSHHVSLTPPSPPSSSESKYVHYIFNTTSTHKCPNVITCVCVPSSCHHESNGIHDLFKGIKVFIRVSKSLWASSSYQGHVYGFHSMSKTIQSLHHHTGAP